jgi:hypothetical protein
LIASEQYERSRGFPPTSTRALLAGAQFADAFSITVAAANIDARHAANAVLIYSPQWMTALLKLRNYLVAPFGLTTPAPTLTSDADTIGIFPVPSDTPARLVAGLDDKHLDFRVVVDVAPSDMGQQVTLTTLVLTHNPFGRAYLTIIKPFHRLIARAKLRHVAA